MKDYSASEEKVISVFRSLIKNEGYNYIYEHPFDVYKVLIDDKDIDDDIASIMLYVLVSKAGKNKKNANTIKTDIDKKLFLQEEMKAIVFNIIFSLFNKESIAELKAGEYKGVDEFCAGQWEISMEGSSTWCGNHHSVYKGYWFKWKLIIKVKDRTKVEQKFEKELKKNPFLDANAILATYEKEMDDHFADDFDDYCTCDEYYEPVVEDFVGRIREIESMLEKYGLELIDDKYTYDETDYY